MEALTERETEEAPAKAAAETTCTKRRQQATEETGTSTGTFSRGGQTDE